MHVVQCAAPEGPRCRIEPSGSVRVVELAYVVHGAVAIRGARGSIRYEAIPLPRDYDVGEATLTFSVPPGTPVYDVPPEKRRVTCAASAL